jgi:putative ABC transport system substrate-binding protein
MRLRTLGLVAACALSFAVPVGTEAQQAGKVWRVGLLGLSAIPEKRLEAFRQALGEKGYVEGRTLTIDYRTAGGVLDRLEAIAIEMIRAKPDVLVTSGTQATQAAKKATSAIPIVMGVSGDAVGTGLVASLARPGGNITGLTAITPAISGKRLELLKEIVPNLTHIAALSNPDDPPRLRDVAELKTAAAAMRIRVTTANARAAGDFDAAFATVAAARTQALLVFPDPLFNVAAGRIVDFAARQRLPAMYGSANFVERGGLMSFGTSFDELFRRAATYVDKIFKGAKPGDLPVEQPTKFELVINLKTAKVLGSTIPQSILIRADQMIDQ